MLTPEQEQWINSLNSERKIKIVPYDVKVEKIFNKVKKKIQEAFAIEVLVEHRGASSFKISGQDEIDVYIPVEKEKFPMYIESLEKIFGEARKHYPDRVRFEVKEDGKKIDLFLMDVNHPNWINNIVKFHNYLQSNPEDLERYRVLKEQSDGVSVQEYYRRKMEFVNSILEKVDLEK